MSAYPKRLIEVDLPIKRISAHARREKSIRHGHISTLHIWWARRPLAACRAVICAALWPDPADELCPDSFRIVARTQMTLWAKEHLRLLSAESMFRFVAISKDEKRLDDLTELRAALLDFIADFSNWDNSTVKEYLEASRTLTQAAHEALGGEPGTRPLVVDPFAGGGSIPLEALRVGADAFASDLNPVAVLLNKVVLEYIPKYGQHLADEVRKWGEWIKKEAERELAEFYPKDPDGATPIAYLWARTIKCEGPGCGAEVPLLRSLCLSRSSKHFTGIRPLSRPRAKRIDFEIVERATSRDAQAGTISNGSATCPCCGFTTSSSRVRKQLVEKKGGASDARLVAVCIDHPKERRFRIATDRDRAAYASAAKAFAAIYKRNPDAFPSEIINPVRPHKNTRGVSAVTRIGCERFLDLYNPRQALCIYTLYKVLSRVPTGDSESVPAHAVGTILALAVNRAVSQNASLCRWDSTRLTIKGAFSKQALAVVWDYAEANPFSGATSDWNGAVEWVAKCIEANSVLGCVGVAVKAPAAQLPLPSDCAAAVVTDPPYFAAIPYADLSDFFYVWLRRGASRFEPDLLKNASIDKTDELIVTDAHRGANGVKKDGGFFRKGLASSLSCAREVVQPNGVGVVVYAEATTAGWESALGAIIDSGWIVVSSWPIDTEMENRTRAHGAASLQSSVHIVCRPRQMTGRIKGADVGDWRDVLSELPHRIHEWLPRLAEEGVVGADAIFSCLGPALEVFSRYSRVEKASGEQVTLREYLEQVWGAVAKEALDTIFKGADTRGFEQDARLTAIWFWVMKEANGNGRRRKDAKQAAGDSSNEAEDVECETEREDKETAVEKNGHGYAMEFDAARKLAQGLGVDLMELAKSGGILSVHGSMATLLSISRREERLIGRQSALFGDELPPAHDPRGRRAARARLKSVTSRKPTLFDPEPDVPVDPSAPFLPGLEPLKDIRSLMQRLLDNGTTMLDRLHQAMLLFGRAQTAMLRPFLTETGMGQNDRFWTLAQALSALYPPSSDEKRWVDGVLARKKGLGL